MVFLLEILYLCRLAGYPFFKYKLDKKAKKCKIENEKTVQSEPRRLIFSSKVPERRCGLFYPILQSGSADPGAQIETINNSLWKAG